MYQIQFLNQIFILCLLPFLLTQCAQNDSVELNIDSNNMLRIPGTIYPNRYNHHPDRAQGHHAIVWQNGGASGKALIESKIADDEILNQLIRLGATAGNNLPKETWLERNNPNHPAPDLKVQGTKIDISITWSGLTSPIPIQDLFESTGQAGFEPRLGGHADQISYWKSGCIFCLFSCPGGRISNAGATIRQQTHQDIQWTANESILPEDSTPVEILMNIRNN